MTYTLHGYCHECEVKLGSFEADDDFPIHIRERAKEKEGILHKDHPTSWAEDKVQESE